MDELREIVARELWASDRYGYQNSAGGDECARSFADFDTNGRANYLGMADRVLAIPEIAEALKQKRYWEKPHGDAGDAIDFACGHCEPTEALAFLEAWREDGAAEWPGYMRWLKVQQNGALSQKRYAEKMMGHSTGGSE